MSHRFKENEERYPSNMVIMLVTCASGRRWYGNHLKLNCHYLKRRMLYFL